MITDNEKFIEIQGILSLSDISPNDCVKIDNLIIELSKENQELKKHLKVPKACNLKTLEDYKSYYEDTTREQILEDTYIEYCAYVNLAHRYSELKKQLEEINKMIRKCGFVNIEQVMLNYCGLLSQQKEFIKWLEDYINLFDKKDIYEEGSCDMLEEILQKYRSIIGGNKDENNKQ